MKIDKPNKTKTLRLESPYFTELLDADWPSVFDHILICDWNMIMHSANQNSVFQ